jgi:hypothetical protein
VNGPRPLGAVIERNRTCADDVVLVELDMRAPPRVGNGIHRKTVRRARSTASRPARPIASSANDRVQAPLRWKLKLSAFAPRSPGHTKVPARHAAAGTGGTGPRVGTGSQRCAGDIADRHAQEASPVATIGPDPMLAERLLPLPKLLGPEVGLCSSPPVVDVGPITSVPAFALTRAWSALKNPANVSP